MHSVIHLCRAQSCRLKIDHFQVILHFPNALVNVSQWTHMHESLSFGLIHERLCADQMPILLTLSSLAVLSTPSNLYCRWLSCVRDACTVCTCRPCFRNSSTSQTCVHKIQDPGQIRQLKAALLQNLQLRMTSFGHRHVPVRCQQHCKLLEAVYLLHISTSQRREAVHAQKLCGAGSSK